MPSAYRANRRNGEQGRRSHVPYGRCFRKKNNLFGTNGRCGQCEYRFRIKGKIQRCCNMTMCKNRESPTMYKDRFCRYHWFLITKGQPHRLAKELENRYASGQLGDETFRSDIFWQGQHDADDRVLPATHRRNTLRNRLPNRVGENQHHRANNTYPTMHKKQTKRSKKKSSSSGQFAVSPLAVSSSSQSPFRFSTESIPSNTTRVRNMSSSPFSKYSSGTTSIEMASVPMQSPNRKPPKSNTSKRKFTSTELAALEGMLQMDKKPTSRRSLKKKKISAKQETEGKESFLNFIQATKGLPTHREKPLNAKQKQILAEKLGIDDYKRSGSKSGPRRTGLTTSELDKLLKEWN